LDRSHERAAHIIRLEVSHWHEVDMPKQSLNVRCRGRAEVIAGFQDDRF
jgi:hypothetical protein